uniref:1-phosphatidylinositol-3-phosphate 5-kinase n=1 Tax=Rhizophora mucronata TaxID=61149 RepID=A0A2P2MEB2_RHIMU
MMVALFVFVRSNQEGVVADNAQDIGYGFNGHLHQSRSDGTLNVADRLCKRSENNFNEKPNGSDRGTVRNVEILRTANQETKDSCSENAVGPNSQNENFYSVDEEIEAQLWEPPEGEDSEDEFKATVAFSDDDDEYGDGTKWGKPSSLSSSGDEGRGSRHFKEEKQKAMDEVFHGKFKTVVSQLLKTESVASSGNDGANWVDIVTSLSWEAALFLKPDAVNGKAIDPNNCVKVKCIATGSRNESQVIKGLVFKKRAAHKHMPIKYKNPRLLLIRGVLGQSSSGLSSFKTIEQENDNVKSIVEMIDMCHPNVVLVEKSVSRDVQEAMLAKGMTLVYDMKLHRLERVARCTGSPILSSDALLSQKLKHCDSFHIEKFIEEHAVLVEGGKRPSKTLMFIEGCPTRLGCTVLLKGSHSEELKRIKCVVQIAVIMAYHLILETSYLIDRNAMFSTILFAGALDVLPRDQESSALVMSNSITPFVEEYIAETGPSAIEVPIYSGLNQSDSNDLNIGSEGNATFSNVQYNPAIFSGFSSLSTSLKKVIGENFPRASVPYQSLSNYFGFGRKETDGQVPEDIPFSKSLVASGPNLEAEVVSEQWKSLGDGQSQSPLLYSNVPLDGGIDADNKEDQVQSKDDISAVLNSKSILVLMSSRNALRGTMCEQSHFSHIMFYRNFDVPLGNFLRGNLLNQRSQCSTCGELPEAHFYYYAHHDKQLTIRVKRLLKPLPGEAEGRIWMWSCCGKCKHENGFPRSTKRVTISTTARNLSFGKFLELSLSHHFSFDRLSRCGHSLERDFVYFFGLGPLAAMFKYSLVTTYFVSLPPLKLEFSNSIRHEGLTKDFEQVRLKGSLIFLGVADALEKMRSQFSGSTLNLRGSYREFSDIEDMLKLEGAEFEVRIQNAVADSRNTGKAVYGLLSLNRLLWELLLVSYVWEWRLHSLLLPDPSVIATSVTENVTLDQLESKFNATTDGGNQGTRTSFENGNELFNNNGNVRNILDTSFEADEFYSNDIPVDGPLQDAAEQDNIYGLSSVQPYGTIHHRDHTGDGNYQADNLDLSGHMQVKRTIPIDTDIGNGDSIIDPDASSRGTSQLSLISSLEISHQWFWMPLSEIRQIYLKDLQRGFMPKFKSISGYLHEHVSAAYQMICEESPRLHVPLGNNDYIVRDYDGELSSIIACALAFLEGLPVSTETFNEEGKQDSIISSMSTDGTHLLTRVPTNISPYWSSNGSSDLDSLYSTLRVSSEESSFSSFDGLNLLESLVPPENFSPEVCLGVAKSLGRGKYSVVCLYAKQFRDLRSQCCQSELDYIASLSRCRNWDAKGGKSKSFFAKTLDDRFIIKEIKKTEFESFVKFAPHYFKYMSESFELGNQTCLAKVFGIYQVIIRPAKSGKEMRHDLMVMENLTFGWNITRQYDLKGALHARFNSATNASDEVLLDQNFVNDMNSSPLYVSNKAKRLFERAVWNDTTFLNSINVMDYSLLVGVDTTQRVLVCGIIDYLRQYTWDKQLETWVKSSLVVPKNVLPTIISPREYKKRFRKFMSTHFLSVPDRWCLQKSSNCCELCGTRDDNSPHLRSQS